MYRQINSYKKKLMPRDGERLLTINDLKSQRPFRPQKAEELARIMREDLFLTGSIGIGILKYENNRRVLLNGQHQCHAMILANVPIWVMYEEYECDTPDDVSLLFRQFDNAGVRSLADKTRVEVDSLGLNWNSKIASLIVGAIAFRTNLSTNEKVELLRHYQDFGEFVRHVLVPDKAETNTKYETKHMRRVPVIYSMLQTFNKNREMSVDFWCQVRDGEGLRRNMPTYKLRNFLITHNYGYGKGSRRTNSVTWHEMISKCITAWNAYRKNTPTDLKYYSEKPIPKAT